MIKRTWLLLIASSVLLFSACAPTGEATEDVIESESVEMIVEIESKEEKSSSQESEVSEESSASSEDIESKKSQPTEEKQLSVAFDGYRLIEVDGGDLSGYREANVVVDIGFGDRQYWAFTNEHGQLVRVVADEIVIQDDTTEPVNSNGRYYSDEAKVPGTEDANLDEGHIIADSLGGVANAYNITPQDSVLNRHGDQAYMERTIQQAGGATNFEAVITYPNITTQIPSSYQYTYTVNGNQVADKFDNINPDEYNEQQGVTGGNESSYSTESSAPESAAPRVPARGNLSSVDTNGNGTVTIDEAKSAGYSMPITSDHWLYQYMRDNDNDGMVGE